MNSKNVKVVDEHNIDRNANVMFAFDLEGSEYVSYWIERDEENSNIFVSKIIKNLDNTFNMLDIEDSSEKSRLNEIIKALITNAVESQADKLVGESVTISGKTVKFMAVSFNKEQRMNIPKTYITTVKKEVTRVAEKYYFVEVKVEQPKVEEIFPTVTPVVEPVKEIFPEVPAPVVESQPAPVVVESITVSTPEPVVVETPVLSVPTVEVPKVETNDNFVAFGTESTVVEPKVEPQVLPAAPVVEPVKEVTPVVPTPVVESQPTPVVAEPVVVSAPVEVPAEPVNVAEPVLVVPTPEPVASNNEVNQPLVFNASKETNLNAALGEVASSTTIPVDNIQSVREFGVEESVGEASATAGSAPVVQQTAPIDPNIASKKGGFADSKFFMVVAIAFFLASCVFLGYEVFNYFQLTK